MVVEPGLNGVDQAKKFAESLANGQPERMKIALTVAEDKVRELI